MSRSWAIAQKSDARSFRPGHVLGFHRAVKGIVKNELLELVRTEGNKLIARNYAGTDRSLTEKQAKSFEVYEAKELEVSVGDRLLLTANRRDNNFRATNGELVTVAGVDGGQIRLDDGRTLPSNYRQFDHGYAVTAHRSQGKSVDSVIISGHGMRRELFYVAASRGRRNVRVITTDKEALRDTVARSTARKSATELARKIGALQAQGERRGLVSAIEMVRRNYPDHQSTDLTRVRAGRRSVAIERPMEPERRGRGYERGISR